MRIQKFILESTVVLLVILFLYTALSKFLDLESFRYDMHNQPLPKGLSATLVWLVPLIEITIVIALLFERSRLAGLYGALVLMSSFTIYTGLVLAKAFHRIPCSCGGVIKQLTWPQHLIFNLFFVGITYIAIKLNGKDFTRYNRVDRAT